MAMNRKPEIDVGLQTLSEERQPGEKFTNVEIAQVCQCSEMLIRKIEAKALAKFRLRIMKALGMNEQELREMTAALLARK